MSGPRRSIICRTGPRAEFRRKVRTLERQFPAGGPDAGPAAAVAQPRLAGFRVSQADAPGRAVGPVGLMPVQPAPAWLAVPNGVLVPGRVLSFGPSGPARAFRLAGTSDGCGRFVLWCSTAPAGSPSGSGSAARPGIPGARDSVQCSVFSVQFPAPLAPVSPWGRGAAEIPNDQ